MINPHELLFTVDENNKPIEPVERWKAHRDGIWHRNCHIWVFNKSNQVLCHQRSLKKDSEPGKWEAFLGGHVLAGIESSVAAALELYEESGIKTAPEELEFYQIYKHSGRNGKNNEYVYVYFYRWNGLDNDLKFEKDEIEQVEWILFDKLEKEIFSDPRWTNPPYLIDFFKFIHTSKLPA